MAPSSPWPDYQCTEPKAPDKKSESNQYSSSAVCLNDAQNRSQQKKDMCGDKEGDEIEIAQLKPQVTALDEFGLKALLDEAMSFRFSEDVEGKSVLLKGLFEEVNSKKTPRTVTTDVPKQSSSGKSSKKNKIRRSHIVSDQNEIGNHAKHKVDSKSSSKSILGPKNVDTNESIVSRDTVKSHSEVCKISSIDNLVSDINKKTKLNNGDSTDNCKQKPVGSFDEIIKNCDLAKIVTVPGGNRNSSEGKNSKNMIKIPSVSDIDKRPKEHYTPNIDKICRKIDQKDIERVKALSQGSGVKEISIPSTHLNSNKITSDTLLRNHVEVDNRLDVEERKQLESFDGAKTMNSENELSSCYLRDISLLCGEEPFVKIKKIDENGNALNSSRLEDGRKGKTRRVKAKNDKNTIMSQHIEGYRGDSDIEAVIQYIESTGDKRSGKNGKQTGLPIAVSKQGRITNKIRHIRDKSSETVGRKGRKTSDSKFKKSNSLEEVSTTKLEDLTHSISKVSVSKCLDNSDFSQMSCKYDIKLKNDEAKIKTNIVTAVASPKSVVNVRNFELRKDIKSENESAGESEFHIVTKKHRKKKRIAASYDNRRNSKSTGISGSKFERRFNDGSRSRRDILNNYRYLEESRGRKPAASVPPSDKSADSSDVDSVHSLPVSSSSLTLKNNSSPNESSLTSYADIARSVTSPPRGGSTPTLNKPPTNSSSNNLIKGHCISSEEIPCVTLAIPKNRRSAFPSASLDINIDKDYPPLKKLDDKKKSNDTYVEFTFQIPKSNTGEKEKPITVEETVSIKQHLKHKCINESTTFSMPLEDSLSKRPPVILMNEKSHESSAVNELVFGFEVNQQLLVGGQNDPSAELIEANNTVLEEEFVQNDPNINPNDHSHSKNFNYYSIVQYISKEWKVTLDELNNDKTGNIRYFKP